ncbi:MULTISPECIES: DUF2812 domain-containing protein [Arthrobacter]|uniref:DUF2812 domain-containing protein n=1 Tax=Arthrobacter sunyaminii TaxID=2816859 RepID=A0A975S4P2_9MICC|nr:MULTISPECIES: DUF2812 domain-containing protein [Arthrobacter]MBO0895838.1 DUF2812 domain-containing protein [Arthrobacter sunyaminii]MBO0907491.1 DUF2812 domain-containing protein [Arthrobacter sunyaminii]QWQ35067.1 DUF2812 domain-containing protein [Arthrobacter sunyaminii]
MTTTSRMGSGLAFSPEKDLAMFAEMALQGKHLNGVAKLGHGWSFVDGAPEEAVFDLAYESSPSPDYFDIFQAAGWAPVLSLGDAHIFKAVPGTAPVHTGFESRRDELTRNRDRYLRYSAITLIAFLLFGLGIRAASWNEWAELVLLAVFILPVVYTVIPLVGYWHNLNKLNHSS